MQINQPPSTPHPTKKVVLSQFPRGYSKYDIQEYRIFRAKISDSQTDKDPAGRQEEKSLKAIWRSHPTIFRLF
jgi:hypothetical protein